MKCKHIESKRFCKNISKVIFSGHIIQFNQAILQCFSCVKIKGFNLLSSLVYTRNLCNSHCRFRIRLEQERFFVQDAQLRENVINKFQFTGCFSKGMVFRFTTEPTNLRRFLGTLGNGGTICKNSKTIRWGSVFCNILMAWVSLGRNHKFFSLRFGFKKHQFIIRIFDKIT